MGMMKTPTAQRIAEFSPTPLALVQQEGRDEEPVRGTRVWERPGRLGQRPEVTGLVPPTQRTLGSGRLLPALGCRGVGLDLSSLFYFIFFSFGKEGRFIPLSCFYFAFSFFNGVGCSAGITLLSASV